MLLKAIIRAVFDKFMAGPNLQEYMPGGLWLGQVPRKVRDAHDVYATFHLVGGDGLIEGFGGNHVIEDMMIQFSIFALPPEPDQPEISSEVVMIAAGKLAERFDHATLIYNESDASGFAHVKCERAGQVRLDKDPHGAWMATFDYNVMTQTA